MDLARHKKATFDFEILDRLEAGIVLSGGEVKAIRAKKAKLEGAHVLIRGSEAFIVGMHIAPYQAANTLKDYEADATRKLLLTRKELDLLDTKTEEQGLTAIPIRLYNKGRKIKVEVGIARGKKKYDKRESIKQRDTERDLKRTLKYQ